MHFFLSVALSATVVATIAATATGSSSNSNSGFIPHRIPYDDLLLLDDSSRPTTGFSLLDALEESSGLVSVTHLPHDFATIKKEVMSHLHSCLLEQQQQQQQENAVVAEESFLDGTIRRTFATATTVTDGQLPMKLLSTGDACRLFEKNLDLFRAIANMATQRFAKALSRAMEPHLLKPLLSIKNGSTDNSSYDTIEDLVDNGEVLEHFHSYQKIATKRIGEEYNDDEDDTKKKNTMTTIDLHTDQGFFIAFTPGMTVKVPSNSEENTDATADVMSSSSSDGFYIIEEGNYNGIPIHVDFDVETDDLVFMLGDGVNQYINNRVIASGRHNHRRVLRATPHAVSLKYHDDKSFARVWYGRMVLPPNDALVAMEAAEQTTLTYGDVRRRLVETPDEYIPAGLGCSSSTMRALQHGSTHEEESACEKGSLFCWARCMDLSDYELTEEMCEEQNLGLKCINPRGQFSTGEKHGDFFPVCTNTTLEVTPYPEIHQKDTSICSSSDWELFMTGTGTTLDNNDDVTYDHTFDLTNEKNDGAAFQWSVIDEEKGIIQGRLVFGNVFGWLSMGFANEGGKHNGMNGGNILMALPGMNYTTMYGLNVPGLTELGSDEIKNGTDISVDIAKRQRSATTTTDGTIININPDGSSVAEYQISPDGSSFRHWSEPTTTGTTATTESNGNNTMNVVVSDCFTSLTFHTDHINGKFFNVSGIDDLMWAGNSQDYHVGYHGRGNRARFYINWKTGEGSFWTEEEDEAIVPDHHGGDSDHHSTDHDDDDSGGPANNNMMSQKPILTSILLAVMSLQLL